MRRIGIYGGTFNPIHNGHLHILKAFTARIGLEQLVMIPSCVPPHKNGTALADAEHRLAMCRLAAESIRETKITVSEIEIQRGGKSYTAETLTQLKREQPDSALFFIMGEDMLLTLNNWYQPARILRQATICASPRSGDGLARMQKCAEMLREKYEASILLEDIPYLPISSTEIRNRLALGRSIEHMVPKAVAAYIDRHGLYRTAGQNRRDK